MKRNARFIARTSGVLFMRCGPASVHAATEPNGGDGGMGKVDYDASTTAIEHSGGGGGGGGYNGNGAGVPALANSGALIAGNGGNGGSAFNGAGGGGAPILRVPVFPFTHLLAMTASALVPRLRLFRAAFACTLLGLSLAGAAQAATIYVKTDGTGNGSSWNNATNLQAALTSANSGDQIWVAQGVYKPTTSTNDRAASFLIRPGLQVFGGFVGNETSVAQADPGANRTVLSGDIDGNDSTDANGIVLDANQIAGSNTYIVVRINGTAAAGSVGADTVLDGFAITAGSGSNQEGLNASVAGGLYCNANANERTCSPTLRRIWFAGNRADVAGAMLIRGENGGTAKPLLHDVTFSGNRAISDAGAIYNYGFGGEASPTLINVTFSANHAGQRGGAMFNKSWLATGITHPVLTGVTLHGNTANVGGGAIFNDSDNGSSSSLSLSLDAVVAWGNSAPSGAEIYQLGGNGASVIRDSVIAVPGTSSAPFGVPAGGEFRQYAPIGSW